MERLRQILITMVVVLITAMSVYNTQRTAPCDDVGYQLYCYSYFSIMFISFDVILIAAFIGYRNRIIKACYIVCLGVFISMFWKALNHTVQSNNYYDWTLIGLVIIVATIYLVKPYFKDVLSLVKYLTNQIYAACQRARPKRKTDT